MRSDSQPAHWLADFHDALSARDKIRLQGLFLEDCYWRDFLAFTWNIITLEGRAPVLDMLLARVGEVKPEQWQIESVDAPGERRGGMVQLRDRGWARQGPPAAEGRSMLDILHHAARTEGA